MEVNIKFDLPAEKKDFQLAINGPKLNDAGIKFDTYLREKIADCSFSEDTRRITKSIRDIFHQHLEDADVTLYH